MILSLRISLLIIMSIAALHVESLYPNIDHEKDAKASKYYLKQRNNQCVATKVLKHLILLIVRMNTMMFCGRYFHQTKRTAMGTPGQEIIPTVLWGILKQICCKTITKNLKRN